jgi:hypothetical protein
LRLEGFESAALDVSDLSSHVVAAIAEHWVSRAQSELTSGVVFANISLALLADGSVTPEIAFSAARAHSDEVRHAEICRRVALRYRGGEVPFPRPRAVAKPAPTPSQARLAATLHVVQNCCFNESVAMVFLRTCLDQAEHELVRLALRELMREEVDHSRIGWAHLSSAAVTDEERRAVARAVPGFSDDMRTLWLGGKPAEVPRGHGVLARQELEQVVEEALAELILPGLEHCGVTADGAVPT